MEKLIRMLTWRGALRISGCIVLFLGLPFSLLCKSPKETSKELDEKEKKEKKRDNGEKSKRDLSHSNPGEETKEKSARKSEQESSEVGRTERTALCNDGRQDANGNLKHDCEKNRTGEKNDIRDSADSERVKSGWHKWRLILGTWRCWAFIISVFISTFSWSFYWVNLVSQYDFLFH